MSFVEEFNKLAAEIHEIAKSKGWWNEDRNDGEMIALVHSELSEALEGLRTGNPPDDKVPEFSSAEVEFADAIVRMMDQGHKRGWRIAEALVAKVAYNRTRAYKHGGKKF